MDADPEVRSEGGCAPLASDCAGKAGARESKGVSAAPFEHPPDQDGAGEAGARTWFIKPASSWLVLLVGSIAVGWLAWRSMGWPLVHDAPIMHYVAWRIAEGAVPYRDLFDMNFPGVYLLHLLVVTTLGAGDVAWRLFDLAWLAVTGALLFAIAAPWGRPAALGAALFFALYHLAGGAWQAGQRDLLLVAFLLAGALGVARWLETAGGGRPSAPLAAGGVVLGAALTIKPHALVLVAGLGALIAVHAWRARGHVAAALAAFVAGAVVVPAVVVGWLAAAGALPAWSGIVLEYLLPLYARLGRSAGWSVYRPGAWIAIAVGVALSVGAAVTAGRFGARHAVVTAGALAGVVHFVAQGKGWEYHLYPLAAFATLLLFAEAGPAVARLRRPVAIPLLAVILAAGALLGDKATAASAAGWERDKAARVRRLADELAARLRPGDTVQVLDTTAGGIHALLRLGVREPTRFVYDFHFFHDVGHPTITALRAELVRGLDARPPRLIVLFEQGWPVGGYERLDAFVALRERLARYDLAVPGPGYRIYAQRDRS